jgi:hypothetical protein
MILLDSGRKKKIDVLVVNVGKCEGNRVAGATRDLKQT